MGLQIEDGTGSGATARVDSENKLRTYSVIESDAQHSNEDNGNAYTMLIYNTSNNPNPSVGETSPCIGYIKNGSDNLLVIEKIKCWAETAEAIEIYINQSGTPTNTTTYNPLNMNLGSGSTADGTFYTGTNIGGISGGNLLDRLRVPADNNNHDYILTPSLIIPKNKIMTIYAYNGGIETEVNIYFYYHT